MCAMRRLPRLREGEIKMFRSENDLIRWKDHVENGLKYLEDQMIKIKSTDMASRRERIATAALQGLLSSMPKYKQDVIIKLGEFVAKASVVYADALIAALDGVEKGGEK